MSSGACTTVAELQHIMVLKLGVSPEDCRLMLPRESWRGLFHIVQGILQRGACTPFRGSLDIPGVEVQSVGTDHLGRDSPLRCATLCVPHTPTPRVLVAAPSFSHSGLRSLLKCATTQTCSWGRTVVGDLKCRTALQLGYSPADCRLVLAREGRLG